MKRNLKLLVMVLGICLFTGCAVGRGYIKIETPKADMTAENGKQVFIRSVQDNRQFQDNPSSPDIPSLSGGGTKEATKEIKSRAIARKRNGFGKALGDILLEEGQTVETVVQDAVSNSLIGLGYKVVLNKDELSQDALLMDISIDKFWGWFRPGFWAITLNAEITTTITLSKASGDEPIIIQASASNSAQVANTANWKKVFRNVEEDYMNKVKEKLAPIN